MESEFPVSEKGLEDRGISDVEKGRSASAEGVLTARNIREEIDTSNTLESLRDVQAAQSKAAFRECYRLRNDEIAFCNCLIESVKNRKIWFYIHAGEGVDFRDFGGCPRSYGKLWRPTEVDRARLVLLLRGIRDQVDYLDKVDLNRCFRKYSPLAPGQQVPYLDEQCELIFLGIRDTEKAKALILRSWDSLPAAADCTPSPGARVSLREGIADGNKEVFLGEVFGGASITPFGEKLLHSQKSGASILPKTVDINDYLSLLLAWDTAHVYGASWNIQTLMLKEGVPEPIYFAAYEWITEQKDRVDGNSMYRWYPSLRTSWFGGDRLCSGNWAKRVLTLV